MGLYDEIHSILIKNYRKIWIFPEIGFWKRIFRRCKRGNQNPEKVCEGGIFPRAYAELSGDPVGTDLWDLPLCI